MLRYLLAGSFGLLVPVVAASPWADFDKGSLRAAGVGLEAETLLRLVERAGGKALPPARVRALIVQLGDDSFEKREAASAALEEVGPTALEALRAAAKSDDPETSNRAGRLVERAEAVTVLGTRAARVLLREVKSGSVRRLLALPEAERRVGWLGDAYLMASQGEAKGLGGPAPRRELMAALGHPDAATRAGVLRLLGEVIRGDSFGDVLRLTWSEDRHVRASAAQLLMRHKNRQEEGFKHLVRLLKDKEALVRYEAAQCLRGFCAARGATRAIIGALGDTAKVSEYRDESVGSVAADSLTFVGDEAADEAMAALIPCTRSPEQALARSALVAVGLLGKRSDRLAKTALPHLVKMLEAPDLAVAQQAASAIWLLGQRGRTAEPALLRALATARSDASKAGRFFTERILSTLRDLGPTPEAVPLLARILSSEANDPQQRSSAADALGTIVGSPPAAIKALEAGTKAKDESVRNRCLFVLKRMKS